MNCDLKSSENEPGILRELGDKLVIWFYMKQNGNQSGKKVRHIHGSLLLRSLNIKKKEKRRPATCTQFQVTWASALCLLEKKNELLLM